MDPLLQTLAVALAVVAVAAVFSIPVTVYIALDMMRRAAPADTRTVELAQTQMELAAADKIATDDRLHEARMAKTLTRDDHLARLANGG